MLIDLILLLILVACILSGYRKGLLMSLLSLLIVVLCCFGASAAQHALTPKAVEYLEPRLAEQIQAGIQDRIDQDTQQALDEAGDQELEIGGQSMDLSEITDFLQQFGLDVEETVTEGTTTALEPVAQAAAQAAAHAIAQQIAGAVIFFAAFLVLYLILRSVALVINVVDRLPVIHTLNRAGGAVAGLVGGLLVMVVAAAVLRQAGLQEDALGPLGKSLITLADRLL